MLERARPCRRHVRWDFVDVLNPQNGAKVPESCFGGSRQRIHFNHSMIPPGGIYYFPLRTSTDGEVVLYVITICNNSLFRMRRSI